MLERLAGNGHFRVESASSLRFALSGVDPGALLCNLRAR